MPWIPEIGEENPTFGISSPILLRVKAYPPERATASLHSDSFQWGNRMSMTIKLSLVTLIPVIGSPNLWHSLRMERSAYQAALVT